MIECFDEKEVAALRARGVTVDLCGFLFDARGEVLEQPESQRIGLACRSSRRLERSWPSAGTEKRAALGATLRSGL